MCLRRWTTLACVVTVCGVGAASANADVVLQSTTDIYDSGLYPELIDPGFFAATGEHINATFVGTGKALDNAKDGLADIVVTHAPLLERDFVNNGWSKEALGRAIFHNEYVIVGPTSDPAGVATSYPNDAVGALAAIAASGTSTFVSRNDASGTNVQEQILWKLAFDDNVSPVASQLGPACNDTAGSGLRYQPLDPQSDDPGDDTPDGCDAAGDPTDDDLPAWYGYAPSGSTGQLANLLVTNTCNSGLYPLGDCYTMLDKGTWLKNAGSATNLKLVSEGNGDANAHGDPDLQTNKFHAYVLNDAKDYTGATGPGPDVAEGYKLLKYLTSQGFQSQVSNWGPGTSGRFEPDAFPVITATCGTGPSTVTVRARYNAPPNNPVIGLPVALWNVTNPSTPVLVSNNVTDNTGAFTFSQTPGTPYHITTGAGATSSSGAVFPANGFDDDQSPTDNLSRFTDITLDNDAGDIGTC